MNEIRSAIAVVGPTASGKTDLALELAGEFGGEIVNCDSVQVYRHMNIGTAKLPLENRRGVPHHLIDIIDPDEIFTAGDFMREARRVMIEISKRGRVPVIAGGTGFYFRALLHGLSPGPSRDDDLRSRLAARKEGSLHRILTRFDPSAAARIHPNDLQKLIRALEVCILTRKPITALYDDQREPLAGFRVLTLGLDPAREVLANRINDRCSAMFNAGLPEEVQGILAMGFSPASKGLEAIGYRESLMHLNGILTYEEAIVRTQNATRQYAKRQRTWFRREPHMHWLKAPGNKLETAESAKRLAEIFLQDSSIFH